MTMFSGFIYGGGFPAPQTATSLVPWLAPTTPGPFPGSIPNTNLESATPSAADVFWKAITVGYGAPVDYVIHWLLHGAALTPPQMHDLKRLASARATAIGRAYACKVLPSGAVALVPRDIYPLIESSERTSTSYLVGCAIAALCAPAAIDSQLGGSVGIDYLFHASLLKSAATTGFPIVVNSTGQGSIDFIGVDTHFHLHAIEAKGTGDTINYQQIGRGLDQCNHVIDITLLPGLDVVPRTKSVSAAYVGANAVNCLGMPVGYCVRATVIGLPPAPPAAVPAAQQQALLALIALQAIGAWAFVTATTDPLEQNGDWARFRFSRDIDTDEPVTVAMRSDIIDMAEAAYYAMQAQVANARTRAHEQERIRDTLVDLGNGLTRALANGPGNAPDGMRFSGRDRWVAVQ
ncbi:hypothetical protein BLA6860_07094 [Burkholderia lata]|uniref:hypothetical protein n=1 Tax=Burkholderia lata (strain ATCC 17760 / DSM 23089 / LMG 22485 / NCIMB 9086 / R18194 / 383) TaxID=482957 RepID=UPI001453F6B5|nr:hypothetical protein [Burkholderia lata]VWC42381.1 hypothetical protein BLA6860_07094 [Burkholderia lata]